MVKWDWKRTVVLVKSHSYDAECKQQLDASSCFTHVTVSENGFSQASTRWSGPLARPPSRTLYFWSEIDHTIWKSGTTKVWTTWTLEYNMGPTTTNKYKQFHGQKWDMMLLLLKDVWRLKLPTVTIFNLLTVNCLFPLGFKTKIMTSKFF
jgi:hypothetical protein